MSRPVLPHYQPTGDVVADKATWRSLVRTARRELVRGWSGDDRAARAEVLAEAGLQWVEGYAARAGVRMDRLTVTAFEPMRTEPPVERLSGALRAAGARVLVPITLARPRLDWADLDDPDRSPLGEAVLAQVDVALVPGLAISEAGVRLGQGGGYYDHTLPRLHELTAPRRVPVVVILHDHEVVPQVPADEHDAVVDAVLRPATGVVEVGR
ncbi:5-formyltetrahydrofolate cyclo-ligase [Ornithinimicrobium sufpigmenti]|uniref:5-formyltetrahydrofolate cyclo-ligase n=1 Tax=Ornithinimicrobium sufpigmenti TaxID=2508882 RepID=UPI0015E15F4F|nr:MULTISPECIES: 5-formyltetrahydrofolate cyclo-ligase [unclassified Ornithinimicrobium]